jgi:FKBP-type peptidyl-prolyl cis-trans isomerase (trigger factor)
MPLSREEIKKRMDELARKYVETHEKEIIKELYQLVLQLEKLNEQSDC